MSETRIRKALRALQGMFGYLTYSDIEDYFRGEGANDDEIDRAIDLAEEMGVLS